jgi:hypothetical protein
MREGRAKEMGKLHAGDMSAYLFEPAVKDWERCHQLAAPDRIPQIYSETDSMGRSRSQDLINPMIDPVIPLRPALTCTTAD